MKYYYLDGIEKKGPYTLPEIRSRNLNSDTLVFREGSKEWIRLSDVEDLKSKQTFTTSANRKSNKFLLNWIKSNIKILFGSLATIIIVLISYFIFNQFALSEKEVNETSKRFFNMLIVNSLDNKIFEEIYPKFNLIGDRLVFNKTCKINNISKNSDGNYEVFATYQPTKMQNYPIYLLIGKEQNKTIIMSSKGISYAFYNRVFEYGKKKGCLTGLEDDVEIGKVIKDKDLKNELDLKALIQMNSLYDNLKITKDIREEWGSINGNVTITNKNNIDFGYFDFECNVEFYNRNGQITSSEKVYGINEILANRSASGSVFCTSRNSVKYKIVPVIKETFELKNKIRDKIISNTLFGCN